MATVPELFEALKKKSAYEVVEHSTSPNQIRIVGRVPVDAMNVNLSNWLIILSDLLEAQEEPGAGWTVDASKKYFPVGETKELKLFSVTSVILLTEQLCGR